MKTQTCQTVAEDADKRLSELQVLTKHITHYLVHKRSVFRRHSGGKHRWNHTELFVYLWQNRKSRKKLTPQSDRQHFVSSDRYEICLQNPADLPSCSQTDDDNGGCGGAVRCDVCSRSFVVTVCVVCRSRHRAKVFHHCCFVCVSSPSSCLVLTILTG